MSNHQVQCINKRDRQKIHEKISHIGGSNKDGTAWKLTLPKAIEGIESGKWKFYTSVNGNSVWVIIATNNGHKYLKTEADGTHENNLLSLPECP